jgi:hypothetical protein
LLSITIPPHDEGMAIDRNSLEALKNLISQVDLLISTTTPLPENRTPRCRELLRTALTLTEDLLKTSGKRRNAVA